MRSILNKKPAKDQRERLVLLGLIELYLETGKPVGSNTLRENGFESLSSATIRNYFAKLEEDGLLKQQHSSGGRIPTSRAYKLYAESHIGSGTISEKEKQTIHSKLLKESREIAAHLQRAAEVVSELSQCAVFLSAPRFDQDFVLDVRFVGIDQNRCLCVIITDFGLVHTETLHTEKKLSSFTLKRLESHFRWRLTGVSKPALSPEEEALAGQFYSEVMLRHIVGYTHFSTEDVYKTGFSRLLNYTDFNDATALSQGLSLFENSHHLRLLLRDCCKNNELTCWIGEDLHHLFPAATGCSVIAVPYRINQTTVGAIAILGPSRIPYRQLFGLLQTAAEDISQSLTKSVYKFKISFREPKSQSLDPQIDQTKCLLLEDKSKE